MEGFFSGLSGGRPTEERNTWTLAEWIMRERPAMVNVSCIRDGARLAFRRCSPLALAGVVPAWNLPGVPA